jgi:4-amino-4-deoxy-L-arabinose transferase-like glycosyltransferase
VKIRPVRPDLLVFACAIGVRLLYFLVDRREFVFGNWDVASHILSSGTLAWGDSRTTIFEPLYPLFLAIARGVVGDRPAAVQLVQIGIASAAPVFLYHLTDALTGRRRTALIAGLLLACDPLSVRQAAHGQSGALMGTLLVAFCWAFARSSTTPGAVRAGVWLGLAVLTRTMALPVVALASIVWAMQGRRREAIAMVATALAVFAPYAIRNYLLNGAVLPTRSGMNLFVSTSEYTAALVPEHHPDLLVPHAFAMLARNGIRGDAASSPVQERQEDAMLRRLAWENVKRHPLDQLWLRVKYVGYLFSPFLVPSRRDFPASEADVHLGPDGQVTITNDGALQPRWIRALYTATFAPVLVLAVGGIACRRHRLRDDALLWCVVATFAAAHSVFFPSSYYRVPMAFVLLFFSAVAVDATWRRVTA